MAILKLHFQEGLASFSCQPLLLALPEKQLYPSVCFYLLFSGSSHYLPIPFTHPRASVQGALSPASFHSKWWLPPHRVYN